MSHAFTRERALEMSVTRDPQFTITLEQQIADKKVCFMPFLMPML